jgi:hypothetical protein
MKDKLKTIWTNCQSAGYTALTLMGIIILLIGGLLALPIVLILVVGAVIFIAYKIGITADAIEKKDTYDPDWYLKPIKRYRDDDKP